MQGRVAGVNRAVQVSAITTNMSSRRSLLTHHLYQHSWFILNTRTANVKLERIIKKTFQNTVTGRRQFKCDGTGAETRFLLSAKRTSPLKSAEASVPSTTGSRGVRISGNNAGYTMFRGSVKGTGYPLHSPVSSSLPLRCVTVCHPISTAACTYTDTKYEWLLHTAFKHPILFAFNHFVR